MFFLLYASVVCDALGCAGSPGMQFTGIITFGQICEVLKVVSEASLEKIWQNRAILTNPQTDTLAP